MKKLITVIFLCLLVFSASAQMTNINPINSCEDNQLVPTFTPNYNSKNTRASVTDLQNAMNAINNHIKGVAVLNATQIAQYKSTIDANISAIGTNNTVISSAFEMVKSYDSKIGPIFINQYTQSFTRSRLAADIHTATLSVMQGIMDFVYTTTNLTSYSTLLNGFNFKSSEYFPGKVTSVPDPNVTHTVSIDGSYLKTAGHLVMQEENPAIKPTGTYLAPGSITTVTVPSSMVGKGYKIRVGAHTWDFTVKPTIKRLDRCTVAYPINNTSTKIASPLGGGIYIEVPYKANAGIVSVQIKNAVRSPFYSMKSFHQTTLAQWQNTERKFGAPWADFQTDKYMIQVPTSWIYNLSDPSIGLKEWDKGTDIVSDLMGFPHKRGRETLYLQIDVSIRGGAYYPGYPSVNADYNPRTTYNGNQNHYFLTGVQNSPYHELHEMGHGQLFQKLPFETEAVVNLLYVAVMNRGYSMPLDEAFSKSCPVSHPNNVLTLANTAKEWITSENFKLEKPMVVAEMQYQAKGYAKYIEIVKLFGWNALDKYWKSINDDFDKGIAIDQSINGLILRMSKSAGVDVSPLIHFWGCHPNDIPAMKAAIAAAKIPKSTKIYDMLVQYKSSIPINNQEFRNFATSWWGKQPSSTGYTTEAYHAVLWDSYNETNAALLRTNVQNIINQYFPGYGAPTISITAPTNNSEITIGNTVNISTAVSGSNISKVEFYINNTIQSTDTSSPFSYSWNTTGLTPSAKLIKVVAYNSANENNSNSVLVNLVNPIVLRDPENPANAVNGLDYKYYQGTWDLLPDFSVLTPVKSSTISNYNISGALQADYYGFVFTGFVDVPTNGNYTFYTNSDDGSKLFIGAALVVNNDGVHANVEKSGQIGLKTGKHAIRVEFFEKSGGNTLEVRYSSSGIAKQLIPDSKLYRVPTSTSPAGYTKCANENQSYTLTGICDVAYGANGKFYYQYNKTGTISFNNATFGDPIPGIVKSGYYKSVNLSNVALGKTASQSSTAYPDMGAASKAVDGNTNGVWTNNSVTHTNYQAQAWWKVDLGTNCNLSSVILWNRTECAERLSNFHIDYLNASGSVIVKKDYTGTAASKTIIDMVATGVRSVRVQLYGTNYLSLAEVQVMGVNSSANLSGKTDIAQETLPVEIELAQNYPNPFNPVTAINFALPEAGNAKLAVMNSKGQTVKVLANGNYQAGNHSFDFDGSGLNSGIYFYRLATNEKVITKKMILIK